MAGNRQISRGLPKGAPQRGHGGTLAVPFANSELAVSRAYERYDVSGPGTVVRMTALPKGHVFTLNFLGPVTFANSSFMKLPGATNKTFALGDTALFQSLGDGGWRCMQITPANPGPLLVFEGDSLSNPYGPGVWTLYLPQVSAYFGRAQSLYFATSGDTAANMVGEYATQGGAVSIGSGIEAYYFLLAGVNDLSANTSGATIYGYLTTMWAAARASGYKVVAFCLPGCTNLTAGAQQTERVNLNNLILSNSSLYDYVVRLDILLPNAYVPYISIDGTHFNASINTLIAQEVARTVLGIGAVSSAAYASDSDENIFPNGDFGISQELGSTGATLVSAAAVKYIADGALAGYTNAAGVLTSTRIDAGALGTSAIPGLNGYHQVKATTAISSLANGDYAILRYYVEGYRAAKLGWGTSGAEPLSYACMVYSSNAGTAFIRIGNSVGSRYLFNEIVLVSGWNFVFGTVPGDITGAWNTTNGIGIVFDIFAAGKAVTPASTFNSWGATNSTQTTNSTNLLSTVNSQVFVAGLYASAGVQIATPLNLPLLMRPYEKSLLLCKRQYEIISPRATIFSGNVTSGGGYYAGAPYQVEKRAVPAVTGVNASNGNFSATVGTLNSDITGVYETRVATATGTGLFQSTITADARLS
jgi:hypothetical protein